MARIWVTRARPGAETTAQAVRARGHEPFVAPLLEVRSTADGPIDLSGVGALAFTSANAVSAFTARAARRDLPAFAVGAATARALRDAGFGRVIASDRGVEALAAVILEHRAEFSGAVLHPGARDLAGDLAGALRAGGLEARTLVLYETRPRALPGLEVAEIPHLAAALAHSARAAGVLAEVLAAHPAPRLAVLAISPAALRPLEDTPLAGRRVAARPNETALLDLLGDVA